jgi:hypothetical protein
LAYPFSVCDLVKHGRRIPWATMDEDLAELWFGGEMEYRPGVVRILYLTAVPEFEEC